MEELPLIPCLTKYAKGADSLDPVALISEGVGPVELYPMDKAFLAKHPVDLHYLSYAYRPIDKFGKLDSQFPRINKHLLGPIRAVGGDLLAHLFSFDWDLPGHTSWTETAAEEAKTMISTCMELLQHAAVWYTTTHGLRFVFVLKEALPVDEAARYYKGMCNKLRSMGLSVDLSCVDWTRTMRLPQVRREESGKTWDTEKDPFFQIGHDFSARLDVEELITPASRESEREAVISRFAESKPEIPSSIDEVTLEKGASGRMVQAEWFTQAKRRLRGRDCEGPLFRQQPLAQEGERDQTIHRLVGEAVGLLYSDLKFNFTAEQVFYLFLDSVRALDEDERDPGKDWTDVLWRAISQCWGKEETKRQIDVAKKEETRATKKSIQDRIIDGVRKWAPDVEPLNEGKEEAWAWIESRTIACVASEHFYVMKPDGTYDNNPVKIRSLAAKIRHLGMESVIPLTVETLAKDRISVRKRAAQEIIDEHAIPVCRMEATSGTRGTHLGNPGSPSPFLSLKTYARRELEPRFNQQVETWLRLFAGNDQTFEKLKTWISYFPAFDEGPMCALSIVGDPGIGKGMLVQGLAEMVNTAYYTNHKVFGRFNGDLARTPLVVINEGVPYKNKGDDIGPSEKFRQLTGGDPIIVEEKFLPLMKMSAAPRIIFTANNEDIVEMLSGGKDLSSADREAIATRICHIEASNKAAIYLTNKGGRAYTGQEGHRWVAGIGDKKSDYVVARHFYHYYVNRKPPIKGSRLLMDGDRNSSLVHTLATRSGTAPYVLRLLIQMIEASVVPEGLYFDQDGQIYVTCAGIVDLAERSISLSGIRLNTNTVGRVLQALSIDGKSVYRKVEGGSRRRWYSLNTTLILDEAYKNGMECPKLEEVVRLRTPSKATIRQRIRGVN